MATEPLSRLLRESPDLDPVRDRLDLVRLLQGRYRSVAPAALASSSRVCAIDETTVVVRADNAPVAAALRAIAPRLLAGLNASTAPETNLPEKNPFKNKQVRELTALRVEVQVDAPPVRRPVIPRTEIPAERLAEVARGLSESPLKEALTRLAGSQRKSSTRSKR
jgi:hypothetical protein